MPLPEATANELTKKGIAFEQDVPLAKRTYWRAGGNAWGLAAISSLTALQDTLAICTETGCPVFVLGNGSNLLVSDKGIQGLVLQLRDALATTETEGESPGVLKVGAGLKLTVLLARAQREGWTGLECFAGIPGTIGGAVRMNAGASLGETQDCLLQVLVVSPTGKTSWISKADLNMSYRTTILPKGAVIAFALLQTGGKDPQHSQHVIREHLKRRKATQPLHLPSCGSTFRNPPGDHAGRLIEAAGLKGKSCGAAQISPKHANFIVNLGGATADDIRFLIETAQKEVLEQFGVEMEQEVHFAGDWSHWNAEH
jgi:UDP-N-acetylmuramate dehydrogenase